MFAVIYCWQVAPDQEERFVGAWRDLTRAMLEECGSYGSRLHRCDDGTWLAYARWPDAAARDRCQHGRPDAALALEATARLLAQWRADLVVDLLQEPAGP